MSETKYNKAQLIDDVSAMYGGTNAGNEHIVNYVFDKIIERVKAGDKVTIAGFGIFRKKVRAAREARNPRTGETVKVPAGSKVAFTSAKSFKDALK